MISPPVFLVTPIFMERFPLSRLITVFFRIGLRDPGDIADPDDALGPGGYHDLRDIVGRLYLADRTDQEVLLFSLQGPARDVEVSLLDRRNDP